MKSNLFIYNHYNHYNERSQQFRNFFSDFHGVPYIVGCKQRDYHLASL